MGRDHRGAPSPGKKKSPLCSKKNPTSCVDSRRVGRLHQITHSAVEVFLSADATPEDGDRQRSAVPDTLFTYVGKLVLWSRASM
jgi:hypothetical protein